MMAGAEAPQRPRDFHLRWPTLLPPLRPPAALANQIETLIAATDDPVLLLGVTPELAALNRSIIAADWNATMIAVAWPGDTPQRRAICADWFALPLHDGEVGAIVGDGALTMCDWPDGAQRLLAQLARVLRSGGTVAIRCFATAENAETPDQLADAAAAGELTFHEWRMRFNMAAARADGAVSITSARLFAHYDAAWPDRHDMRAAPAWPREGIAEIDAYRDSTYVHSYPKRSEIGALMDSCWPGDWRFVETTGYPGAGHCPLLVATRA